MSLEGIFDYGQGAVLWCLAGIAAALLYVVVWMWWPSGRARDDDSP